MKAKEKEIEEWARRNGFEWSIGRILIKRTEEGEVYEERITNLNKDRPFGVDPETGEKRDKDFVPLTELPEDIGVLDKLWELSLDGNELKKLPESIGQLRELEKLIVSAHR